MHPAQSPGLVLAALAMIAAACSPLSPTQTPGPGGMRTQTASSGLGLSFDIFPASAASALASLPAPNVSGPQTTVPTIPAGPPSLPSMKPPTAPLAAMPSLRPPTAPAAP
jgi:hypothetical protein